MSEEPAKHETRSWEQRNMQKALMNQNLIRDEIRSVMSSMNLRSTVIMLMIGIGLVSNLVRTAVELRNDGKQERIIQLEEEVRYLKEGTPRP